MGNMEAPVQCFSSCLNSPNYKTVRKHAELNITQTLDCLKKNHALWLIRAWRASNQWNISFKLTEVLLQDFREFLKNLLQRSGWGLRNRLVEIRLHGSPIKELQVLVKSTTVKIKKKKKKKVYQGGQFCVADVDFPSERALRGSASVITGNYLGKKFICKWERTTLK